MCIRSRNGWCVTVKSYLFGKLLKTPIKEAIPGSSSFTSYYMYHYVSKDDADCKIFLLGAKEGIFSFFGRTYIVRLSEEG